MISISAIIVTFNPCTAILSNLLFAISPQVAKVVVVDNGSSESVIKLTQEVLPNNGILIKKGFNSGIATAFNLGILEAEKNSSTHVILFDQDSLPDTNMVQELIQVIISNDRVAAVGPKYSDVKGSHASPFVKLEGFSLKRINCNSNNTVKVDHLISSGCLISMDSLKEVGVMEDKLFVDYVDTEWCLRAIHKGYSLFGVGSAHMQHDLGDEFVYLFGRTLPVHSPLRHYYLIRNGIWLLRQPWVSNKWRIIDTRRLFLIYIVYSLFVGKKFQNWKMMSLGIWHGLSGRMGCYDKY
jgi:rhamnosyltransferase